MALSQPGIFNALDYDLKAQASGGTAAGNQTALQSAISACQAAGGGTVLIPQEDLNGNSVYPIVGPINVGEPLSGPSEAVIIRGTGQGTESQPTLLVEASGDLFEVDSPNVPPPGNQHVGGITFIDLSIKYAVGLSGTAINVITGENVRIQRVIFLDCPQAVWFQDTLQCTIVDCTAVNDHTTPTPACITLGETTGGPSAIETYIAACTFISTEGGVGLIIQGCEHVRLSNVRVEGYFDGIQIIPGGAISGGTNDVRHHFGHVTVYTGGASGPTGASGTALKIQPQGPKNVSNVVFDHCDFQSGDGTTSSGPAIYIDEGGYGSTVDSIRFVSCHSGWSSGPGLQINSGSNIEVVGGLYAGNNLGGVGAMPYGIYIGSATSVRLIGVNCVGQYPAFSQSMELHQWQQAIGIYIAGEGASNVIIDGCDLTGNSQHGIQIASGGLTVTNVFIRNCNVHGYGAPSPAAAIDVVGQVSGVEITDCAGYNDLAPTLSTAAPSGTFSNTSFAYYGPIAFYVTGSSPLGITIDGVLTGLTSGGFTLGPGETAAITGAVSRFLAVGK